MPSRRCWLILAGAVAWVLLDARTAFAWGPATHAKLAGDVLANLALLPAGIAAIIARHVCDYLYGSLAADMVFAKRLSRIKQSCHHWSTGFRLVDEAEDHRSRAFAYGYLAHLAADTVAHGKFVPHQIVTTGTTVNVGHVYWEVRADSRIDERARAALQATMRMDHRVHHAALARVLTNTFLPHGMNRVLFERIGRGAAGRSWRRSAATWDRWARWPLPSDLLDGYHVECTDRALSLLGRGRRSALLGEDPSGTAALAFAADTRRAWRRRRRHGLSLFHRPAEAAAGHAPRPWSA